MKELIIRSISGFLYAALIISAALISDFFFIIVVFIFSSLALYEFQKLIQNKSPVPFILFGVIVYQFFYQNLNSYLHLSLIITCIGINFLLTYFLFKKKKINPLPLQKSGLTIFYIVASGYFIIATSSLDSSFKNGVSISMYLLIWINNSFAYLFGKSLGKRLLFPDISPKKTWEGFWGGALICFLVSFILIPYHPAYPYWTFTILAIITTITSSVGDLIQSKFKRQAKVKDSGSLIPGHGGFYDRMDSVLFTAPFAYLFLMLVNYVS